MGAEIQIDLPIQRTISCEHRYMQRSLYTIFLDTYFRLVPIPVAKCMSIAKMLSPLTLVSIADGKTQPWEVKTELALVTRTHMFQHGEVDGCSPGRASVGAGAPKKEMEGSGARRGYPSWRPSAPRAMDRRAARPVARKRQSRLQTGICPKDCSRRRSGWHGQTLGYWGSIRSRAAERSGSDQ